MGQAMAHDIWIETNQSLLRVGESVSLSLMLGNHGNHHRDFRMASKIQAGQQNLSIIGVDGKSLDLTSNLIDNGYEPKEGFWGTSFQGDKDGTTSVKSRAFGKKSTSSTNQNYNINDVGTALATRPSGHPKMNFVALYACSALYGTNTNLETAFGMAGGDGRAIVGFNNVVYYNTGDPEDGLTGIEFTEPSQTNTLQQHFQTLMEEWAKESDTVNHIGRTLEQAKDIANHDFMPINPDLTDNPMLVKGDLRATLNSIYLASSEVSTTYAVNKRQKWYYVYPNSRK